MLWGNGCGVSWTRSGVPIYRRGGQTDALARADLTESTGGASGVESKRRGVGWPNLVGDVRTRSWSVQGRRRSPAGDVRDGGAPVCPGPSVFRGAGALGVARGGRGQGLRCGRRGRRGDVDGVDGVEKRRPAARPGSTAPAGVGRLSTPVTEREGREI